jgi:hypothetical protein
MKVYLAGSRAELDRCETWQQKLIGEGIRITYNWIADCKEYPKEEDLSITKKRAYAYNDISGVMKADLFWLLIPKIGGCGCWVELGLAIERNQHYSTWIILSGDQNRTLFSSYADYISPSDDEAFQHILNINKR